MNPTDVIAHKRDGGQHTANEIAALVSGYTAGAVADYQMAAWAMAVYQRGMTIDETVALTRAMLESGSSLDASEKHTRVDKHSTGGIGDKTSLVIAPLLACCGLRVPMISGRGLGPTGGTLDKLESIPGLRTDLDRERIEQIARDVGCVITGTTSDLVPADRKLYALRDVTATVGSIPLITASILSKKLAAELAALVIDVKFGSGAFMKTRAQARQLADSLVEVGSRLGLPVTVLLTSMHQPNGRMVGNAVEVDEAVEILAGRGPHDLRELILALSAEILLSTSLAKDAESARAVLAGHLDSGRAHEKFRQMVAAQGGDLDAPRPRAPHEPLLAEHDGYLLAIHADRLGWATVKMGGGRHGSGEPIDHSVGLEVLVRVGDRVTRGQPLANVFAPAEVRPRGLKLLQDCFLIGDEAPPAEPLIAERVGPAEQPATASAPAVDNQQQRALIDAALAARRHAHAPYSGFAVGAAVLCRSGAIYRGTNVENASYGLTICAERAAITAAIAAGESELMSLAVVSAGGATPCGACRQFAAEFGRDLPILIVDARRPSAPVERRLTELLPDSFTIRPGASDQNAGDAGRHEAG